MRKAKASKPKTHKILNHPYLALLLLPAWCMVITTLFGSFFDTLLKHAVDTYAGGLCTVLASLLCLAIHKKWFRGEFDGNLKLKNFGLGLLLLSPSVIFLAENLLEIEYSSLTARNVVSAFCLGAAPGVMEEIAFRGLAGSNFMRLWKEERKIPLAATLTSLVFGAIHLLNISAGAGVASSIDQAVYAFGGGMLFAASYFRSGTLLPSILVHTLVDTTAFLVPGMMETGGVMTDEGFEWGMVLIALVGIGYAVLGYWFLRKEKRPEILKLWSEKWTCPSEEALPEAAAPEAPAEE